jgi:hypothetical protein
MTNTLMTGLNSRLQVPCDWVRPATTGRVRRLSYAPEHGILVIDCHTCRRCRTAPGGDCGNHTPTPPTDRIAYFDVDLALARQVAHGRSVNAIMHGELATHRYEVLRGEPTDTIVVGDTTTYWFDCANCGTLAFDPPAAPEIPGYTADDYIASCPDCGETSEAVALDRCTACFALIWDEAAHECALANVTPLRRPT